MAVFCYYLLRMELLRYIFLAFIVDKLRAEPSSEHTKDGESGKDKKVGHIIDSADAGEHEKLAYSDRNNISLSKKDICIFNKICFMTFYFRKLLVRVKKTPRRKR